MKNLNNNKGVIIFYLVVIIATLLIINVNNIQDLESTNNSIAVVLE